MKVVFIGGCHLVGKPHGVQYGFVRRLWKRWRKESRDVHFDLVPYAARWDSLLEACRDVLARFPDVIIVNIQAALVLPTWDRTLRRLGFSGENKAEDPALNWFAPTAWKPANQGRAYWIAKRAGILLLGGHRENWSRIEEVWQEISRLLKRSPARVIVLTPTPANGEFFVRGQANLERVRELVLRFSDCYEVCDIYPDLQKMGNEALWLDGQHISVAGHTLIEEKLWSTLKNDRKDEIV